VSAKSGQQKFEDKSARPPENEDTTATPGTEPHSTETVVPQVVSNQPLFTRKNQQLGIGRQNFTNGILIFPSRLHLLLDFFHQMLGDVLDVLVAVDHEGQGPERMSLPLCTVAIRRLAARMTDR